MENRRNRRSNLRGSRSFHNHEDDTRNGNSRYINRVDDDMRYGNAREQDYNNNRAHNRRNNSNMEHNPGGGTYGHSYYHGDKGGPGRFDQFNDEFDGNGSVDSRWEPRNRKEDEYMDLYNMKRLQGDSRRRNN